MYKHSLLWKACLAVSRAKVVIFTVLVAALLHMELAVQQQSNGDVCSWLSHNSAGASCLTVKRARNFLAKSSQVPDFVCNPLELKLRENVLVCFNIKRILLKSG